MSSLLFLSTQITYKRFLLLWTLVGMLFTHSWLTEPRSPELCNRIALLGTYSCGFIMLCCPVFSLFVNKWNLRIRISWPVIAIILYFLVAMISGIICNSTDLPAQAIRIGIPIAFGLSFMYAFSEDDLKKVITGIAVFGLAATFFAFAVFLAGGLGVETPFPISGLFTDRNGFGRYLSIVNAFFLIEILSATGKKQRIIHGAILLIIFLGILIQNSRSGYIVYLVSSSIIILASGSKPAKKIGIFFLPFVIGLFGYFLFVRVYSEKMNIANYSDLCRIYVFKSGTNMIKEHPIKGIGFRMSEANIHKYADKNIPGLSYIKTIHNWYVTAWAEEGIAGLLVFCWLSFGLMWETFMRFRQSGFLRGKYSLFAFTALLILMIDAIVLPEYDYESIYWIIIAIGGVSLTGKRPIFQKPALPAAATDRL